MFVCDFGFNVNPAFFEMLAGFEYNINDVNHSAAGEGMEDELFRRGSGGVMPSGADSIGTETPFSVVPTKYSFSIQFTVAFAVIASSNWKYSHELHELERRKMSHREHRDKKKKKFYT
jgi:hypothetical protein